MSRFFHKFKRTCAGCREKKEKINFLRFSFSNNQYKALCENEDSLGKTVYFCPLIKCFEKFNQKKKTRNSFQQIDIESALKDSYENYENRLQVIETCGGLKILKHVECLSYKLELIRTALNNLCSSRRKP
jgi:predicted RNA-binding protein YlxR (DUF448 family)